MMDKALKIAGLLSRSCGLAALVAVFCLVFSLSHKAIFDADIWLHLKAGEWILQHHAIPFTDPFSFTMAGSHWVDHEWLFQVLAFAVYAQSGIGGLVLVPPYLVCGIFFLLLLICNRRIPAFLETAVLLFVAAYASLLRFNIRPDMFSAFFFAAFFYLLRFKPRSWMVWLLVPMELLWVNIHGYYFLGLVMAAIFYAFDPEARVSLKKVLPVLVAVCFLNPKGFQGVLYPLKVMVSTLTGANRIFFGHIQELKPAALSDNSSRVFYLSLFAASILALVRSFRQLSSAEKVLLVLVSCFALTVRNIVFFVVIAVSVIAVPLGQVVASVESACAAIRPWRRLGYLCARIAIALAFTSWIVQHITDELSSGYYDFGQKKFISTISGVEETHYPVKAVDFLLAYAPAARVMNDFNSGAYLVWRGYPRTKVFIDGRTELYGPAFFQKYLDIQQGSARQFRKVAEKYGIDAVLISRSSPKIPDLARFLYGEKGWILAFVDESGAVFLRDTPENRKVAQGHGFSADTYEPPRADVKALGLRDAYPSAYLKRAAFFLAIEEFPLAEKECLQALRVTPDSVRASHWLGVAYCHQGKFDEALVRLRAAAVMKPRDADVLVDLGECLLASGDAQFAAQALRGAAVFSPQYAGAYYQLSRAYLMLGEPAQAIDAARTAVKIEGKNPLNHIALAEGYLAQVRLAQPPKQGGATLGMVKREMEIAQGLNITEDRAAAKRVDSLREIVDGLAGKK